MLEPRIEKALNGQLNYEQSAAQEYLAMAAWFEDRNLRGFARFMRLQSDEERTHGLRLFDHLVDRGGRVRLEEVAAPMLEYESPLAVFQAARTREHANTKSIHELYKLATELGDYATQSMLQWFITEQVEEEAWCDEVVGLLEMVGEDRSALIMLDDRYGSVGGAKES